MPNMCQIARALLIAPGIIIIIIYILSGLDRARFVRRCTDKC